MATAADPDYVVTAEMEAEEAELAKKGKADDQKKLKAVSVLLRRMSILHPTFLFTIRA